MRFYKIDKLKDKRFLYVLMAFIMFLSICFVSACQSTVEDDEDDEDDEDTQIEYTWEPIKNNNFTELYDTSDSTTYPRSPKEWTVTGDTNGEKTSPITPGTYTRYGVISVAEDNFYANLSKYNSMVSLDKYNADKEAINKLQIPYVGAANGAYVKDDEDKQDDKILSVVNLQPTATVYKSTSISIPAKSYARISVWVNTYAISATEGFGTENNPYAFEEGKGAYIGISGGVEEPVSISGIDTLHEWKQFTFYIEGSAYNAISINLELGLGRGNPLNTDNWTEGFAFFDNIEFEFYSQKDYDVAVAGAQVSPKLMLNTDGIVWKNDARIILNDKQMFANETSDELFNVVYTMKNDNIVNIQSFSEDRTNALVDFYDNKAALEAELENEFDAYPFTNSDIYGLVANDKGENISASAKINFGGSQDSFTFQTDKQYRISIWLKTSDFFSISGVNLVLINKDNPDPTTNFRKISNIDTTIYDLTAKEIADMEELGDFSTRYNKWDGWVQYSFFVDYSDVTSVNGLELGVYLGPDDLTLSGNNNALPTYPSKYLDHFVMFSGIDIELLSDSQYSVVSSSDTMVSGFALSTAKGTTQIANGGFESYTIGKSNPQDALSATSWTLKKLDRTSQIYSGILASKYWSYTTDSIGNIGLSKNDILTNDFGITEADILFGRQDNAVLLMGSNEQTHFYYETASKTIAINSFAQVSFSVKTLQGATFSAYLVDNDGNIIECGTEKMAIENQTATDWTDYYFFVRTGYESKTFKLLLYFGSEAETGLTSGAVLFDDVIFNSETLIDSTTKEIDTEKEELLLSLYDDTNTQMQMFNYSEIDLETDDEVTTTPSESEDTTTPRKSQFGWGEVSALTLALVLIFVVGIMGARRFARTKFYKKYFKEHYKAEKINYDRKNIKDDNQD